MPKPRHHSPNINIKAFLDQDEKKDQLRLLTAGSVDDGKSTLIGRLLFDSKKLYDDQLSALERDSKRMGHAGGDIDYALLLDGLKAEREQGITIDVAYRYFSTNKRKFIIADTPGHEQYTRNMVTGASTANLAILLVDARTGVITQTKRHTYIVSLLGINHIVVAINKMDLVDYSQERYDEICASYKNFITGLNIPDINFIPISALKGDNVVDKSHNMDWYHGKCMLEFLETVHVGSDRNFEDLRFPVQFVNRPSLDFRGFSTTMASGVIRKGDTIKALPSGQTSVVTNIFGTAGEQEEAFPPQAITITLADEIDISRGEMIVHPDNMPRIERHFEAMLVWMDEKPMNPNTQFYIKHTTNTTKARFDQIKYKVDVNTMEKSEIGHLELNEIGRVVLTTVKPLFFDPYKKNRETGSFILIDPVSHNTCAVGMIIDKLHDKDLPSRITDREKEMIIKGQPLISTEERQQKLNQKAATLWITGLHGSGKNNLAYKLERKLFEQGASAVLMDGSTVRSGLSKELDYSPADRAEHLRRVAEVCKILNDQGIIVICSFISPKEIIRQQIADIIGKEKFHLIYMDADLDFCKNHKPEFYKKVEAGMLLHVPGIDEPFEKPENENLALYPEGEESNVQEIQNYLKEKKIFPLG
ncbi:MAG: bifunctional sulfate adenylyltransferase subunit 1/adenylylsulfate kinase [Bacteroidetes bacterium HGW-Bacteroidetes-17]|nr:MAG: bifunctional sulfate adenylyltransferase subunit 1/adenylylsulfate kinase [Bacteroidetes bacterium HGW-Bacteroidetes-17]